MPRSVSLKSLEDRFSAKERVELVIERIKEQIPTNTFKKLFIRFGAMGPLGEKRYQYFTDFENFYSFLTVVRYTNIWDSFEMDDINDIDLEIGYQTRDRRGIPTDHILYKF